MPKKKIRTKNMLERYLTVGEGSLVDIPRDERGRFTSPKKPNKPIKEEVKVRQRSIKLKRVKGTYGTYKVIERLIPDDFRNVLYIFIFLVILVKVF